MTIRLNNSLVNLTRESEEDLIIENLFLCISIEEIFNGNAM